VPAGVYLFLLLFLHMVQPVSLMQEKLATAIASDRADLVSFSSMLDKLVIASKSRMAFVTFGLFSAEEAHGKNIAIAGYKAVLYKKKGVSRL